MVKSSLLESEMESAMYLRIVSFFISFSLKCNTKADSYCRPISHKIKLWDCQGSTATFDEAAHERVSNISKRIFGNHDMVRLLTIFKWLGS